MIALIDPERTNKIFMNWFAGKFSNRYSSIKHIKDASKEGCPLVEFGWFLEKYNMKVVESNTDRVILAKDSSTVTAFLLVNE